MAAGCVLRASPPPGAFAFVYPLPRHLTYHLHSPIPRDHSSMPLHTFPDTGFRHLKKPGQHLALHCMLIALALAMAACGKSPEPALTVSGTPEKPATVRVDKPATAESPLAKAVIRGDLEKIRMLLDQGAEVDASDALGRTPLHMAAFYGRPRTTELLLAQHADLNSTDRVGMTPLHAAVLGGSLAEVDLLLGKGANLHAASDTALTPLHLAAATGQTAIVKLLLQRGADARKTDKDGKTPQDFAARNEHPKTLALFTAGAAGKPPLTVTAPATR